MRQKKSKFIYFVIGIALFVGAFYIATHEIPLKTEHVVQRIDNDFLSK